jgi:D-alanyl-D-alanine carboxypeptidase
MKMKSGTMSDTKSFAGYHTSKDGKKYVFRLLSTIIREAEVQNCRKS